MPINALLHADQFDVLEPRMLLSGSPFSQADIDGFFNDATYGAPALILTMSNGDTQYVYADADASMVADGTRDGKNVELYMERMTGPNFIPITATVNTAALVRFNLSGISLSNVVDADLTAQMRRTDSGSGTDVIRVWESAIGENWNEDVVSASSLGAVSGSSLASATGSAGDILVFDSSSGSTDGITDAVLNVGNDGRVTFQFMAQNGETSLRSREGVLRENAELGNGPLRNAVGVYGLALAEHLSPGNSTNGLMVEDFLVDHFSRMTDGGLEPPAIGGLSWATNSRTGAIMLMKTADDPASSNDLWDRFSSDKQSKLELIIDTQAIAANWGFNDANDFWGFLGKDSNRNKDWNPNFSEGSLGDIIAASLYYDNPNDLDTMFENFDFNTYVDTRLEPAGFDRVLNQWQQSYTVGGITFPDAEILLDDDGVVIDGVLQTNDRRDVSTRTLSPSQRLDGGPGANVKFAYSGVAADLPASLNTPAGIDEPFQVYHRLAYRMYSNEVVNEVTTIQPYTYGVDPNVPGSGTTVPTGTVIGRTYNNVASLYPSGTIGMLYELRTNMSNDNPRSDASYTLDGWAGSIVSAASLMVRGQWGAGADAAELQTLEDRMSVGSNDYIYKVDVGGGWEGTANGSAPLDQSRSYTTSDLIGTGFDSVKRLWQKYIEPVIDGVISPTPDPGQAPFDRSQPWGTSQWIAAESFDTGGLGVSFNDAGHSGGNRINDFRTDEAQNGADIGEADILNKSTSNARNENDGTTNGKAIGFTRGGDWYEYTVDLPNRTGANQYRLQLQYASGASSNDDIGELQVDLYSADGTFLQNLTTIDSMTGNGNWNNFRLTSSPGFNVSQGGDNVVVRLTVVGFNNGTSSGRFDIDRFRINPVVGSTAATTAQLQVEAFAGITGSNNTWSNGTDSGTSYAWLPSVTGTPRFFGGFNTAGNPTGTAGDAPIISQTLSGMQSGAYNLKVRADTDGNGGNNSFWIRTNGGTWNYINLNTTSSDWFEQTFTGLALSLGTGNNTIEIAAREDGTRLDWIELTKA